MTEPLITTDPGWLPDPAGRHEARWWDGDQWTARVANNGRTSQDHLAEQPAAPGMEPPPVPEESPNDAADPAVGAVEDEPAPQARKEASVAAGKSTPKWEQDAYSALSSSLSNFRKPLAALVKRDANEGDTRLLVTDFLCDALGYDKFVDLTTEFMVRGEFADYGIRIDKQLVAFVEVKRAAQKLNVRHLRQVETYAVKEGLEWCILTNGQVWQVYHVAAATGQRVETTRVLEIDLLSDESPEAKIGKLFHLHHNALKRATIDAIWQKQAAIAPSALVDILLSESVVDAMRKEVRRRSSYNPNPEDLIATLRAGVIQPTLL